jgi:hypothetical protein
VLRFQTSKETENDHHPQYELFKADRVKICLTIDFSGSEGERIVCMEGRE